MKINSVNYSTTIPKHNTEHKNTGKRNPAFGGMLVGLASFIENNGFMGEFLTIDTCGMGVPRAGQGYLRNRKELGHLNYKAGHEEVRREVLSGPAFFFVPLIATTVAGLLFGKSAGVPRESLATFEKLMKKTNISLTNEFETKKNFVKTVINEAFGEYKNKRELVNELSSLMEKHTIGKFQYKEKIFNLFRNKSQKVDTKAIIEEKAEAILTKLNKANEKFLDNTESIRLGTKLDDKGKTEIIAMPIKTFLSEASKYLDDFTGKSFITKQDKESFIETFHKNATTLRAATEVSAITALSAFLYYIPKIYQTGEDFPGKNGLVNNDNKSASENKTKEAA